MSGRGWRWLSAAGAVEAGHTKINNTHCVLCLVTSLNHGATWTKPKLSQYRTPNGQSTNVVFATSVAWCFGSVLYEPLDPVAGRRFKMVYYDIQLRNDSSTPHAEWRMPGLYTEPFHRMD